MASSITFEPDRLRQARQLALMTKKEVAEAADVSPATIGQYEAGISVPRANTVERLAHALDVPVEFFASGRPLQRLETSETYFESLRATTAKQRSRATSFAEIWELSFALEAHVRFPPIELPDIFGDVEPSTRHAMPLWRHEDCGGSEPSPSVTWCRSWRRTASSARWLRQLRRRSRHESTPTRPWRSVGRLWCSPRIEPTMFFGTGLASIHR